MVAYSFKARFVDPIQSLAKLQTVRAHRARHARPGEAIQLYTGMRTRHCRKILDVDPVCIGVDEVTIEIDRAHRPLIAEIVINGRPLEVDEMEAFAVADGFGPTPSGDLALRKMGAFWLLAHGEGRFEGVVIRWDPR